MNAFVAVLYLVVFSFFFVINAAIAVFGNRIGARVALITSALTPLALYIYVLSDSVLDIGVIATFSDPKAFVLLTDAVVPLSICTVIAAVSAQFVVFRWRNRRSGLRPRWR